jgi:tetrapyrrole methylase family protein/MazG family protein
MVSAEEVHLRTGRHPVADALPAGIQVHTFDHLYEEKEDFSEVYAAIVSQILKLGARTTGVIYGVPGDGSVGEATVAILRQRTEDSQLPIRLVPGVSFIEPTLDLLASDALDGLFIADALSLIAAHHPPFPPDVPALIGQIYSPLIAAEVKITLMNQYPDEHPVFLVHQAGANDPRLESLFLYQIDRSDQIGGMTSLYIPPLSLQSSFETFQETVAHLRAPEGCPWDRKQTHETLRMHILEECYEVLDAIDQGDMHALQEELGDLLLQIVLQAQIATEAGDFTMADVIAKINRKLLYRHPHVFDEMKVEGVEEVLQNWEALKAAERTSNGARNGLLDGVPVWLPALAQALEMQARAGRVGFDWPEVGEVREKINEELDELERAEDQRAQIAELGDLLFSIVNYARWKEIDPEAALRDANRRFRSRFSRIEAKALELDKKLSELSLTEMEALWEAAKEED